MKREILNKRCIHKVQWFLGISCVMFLCACGEKSADYDVTADVNMVEEEQMQGAADGDEAPQEKADYAKQNEKRFYEGTETLGIDHAEAEAYYQKLCEDNVFQGQTVPLVAFNIEDIDQNGQPDMVVMIRDYEYSDYGEGCMYFYMNEDEAYCFRDEEFPFFWGFNTISGDFDDDGYMEIAFESLGLGVGGAGDWHPRILKYRDHTMEPMEFPFDDEKYGDDMPGIHIEITQEAQANTYSAYCAYLDETIVFESENAFELDGRQECGGNSRGYCDLRNAEYEGKDALEVSEYLYGEGGIAHGLGLAKFLIVWDQDGEGRIVKWWIEPW